MRTDTQPAESSAFRACDHCRTWNKATAESCRRCGKPIREDDYYSISFSLGFPAGKCTNCGRLSPPGACVHCGAEVDKPEEEGEEAKVRRSALETSRKRAKGLLDLYDALPEPHVPLAADQYATALVDARLLLRVRASMRFPRQLSNHDLSNPKDVGGPLRQDVRRYVASLEAIYRATEELAWFKPPAPEVERARTAMINTGRFATEIAVSLLEMLVAPSIGEIESHHRRFQELLSGYPYEDELAEAQEALMQLPFGGVDERVSLALGAPIVATDAAGLLDPARVFTAFAGEDDAFTPLARASTRYFRHLTEIHPDQAEAEASILAMPALALAALDRPLVAHRVARGANDLLRIARARNAEAADELLKRTTNEGPRIFAAAKRIHDDLVYLESGSARDDDEAIGRLVVTYKRLAESSFRTYAWLVVDAQRVAEGQVPSLGAKPPLLGQLEQRLSSREDGLSKILGGAAKRSIRNAEAHEDYRFDAKRQRLIVAGKPLSLDRFSRRFEHLVAVALGLDTAFTCVAIEFGATEVPEWLPSGEAPFAAEMLMRGMLYARGLEPRSNRRRRGSRTHR